MPKFSPHHLILLAKLHSGKIIPSRVLQVQYSSKVPTRARGKQAEKGVQALYAGASAELREKRISRLAGL